MIDNLIFVTNSFFQIYVLLILVRCFLSFIPSINWYKQPFEAIKDSTDLYLNLFRRIIPPFGGLDFSPIVAVIVLQLLNYLIIYILFLFK